MRKVLVLMVCVAGGWWLTTGCSAPRKAAKTVAAGPVLPSDPVLRKLAADSLFMEAESDKIQGNLREAITHFNDYLKIDPGNATVYYELAALFNQLRNPGAAVSFARRAAELDPANQWYQTAYANALAANHEPDSAAAVFARLARAAPGKTEYLFNEGILLSAAGKYDSAIGIFRALEQETGVTEDLVYQLQRIYLKLKQPENAAAEIRKLIEQNPQEPRYYFLLAQVYTVNDMTAQALQTYRELLAMDPRNPQALIGLALSYKRQGDEPDYDLYMKKAFTDPGLSIDDKIDFVYPFLKYVEVDSSEAGEALMLCRMIVSTHPANARAYDLYGDMLATCHQPDSALTAYRQALALDSSDIDTWQKIMFIEISRQQNGSLLRTSAEVIKRFPDQPAGWYFNGLVNIFLKNNEEGIYSLNRALEAGVDDTDMRSHVYSTLGEAYQSLQQYGKADSCFDAALALTPGDDATLNNYSYYLALRGDQLGRAEQMSRESLALSPDNYVYEDTYAYILFRMGKYRQAKAWMEKALRHTAAQNSPGYLEHYGDILYKLRDVSGAVKYWELARQKGGRSEVLEKKIALRKYFTT